MGRLMFVASALTFVALGAAGCDEPPAASSGTPPAAQIREMTPEEIAAASRPATSVSPPAPAGATAAPSTAPFTQPGTTAGPATDDAAQSPPATPEQVEQDRDDAAE